MTRRIAARRPHSRPPSLSRCFPPSRASTSSLLLRANATPPPPPHSPTHSALCLRYPHVDMREVGAQIGKVCNHRL